MTLYVAVIIFCIVCSAFFSSSEMAYSSCNHLRLENAKEDGNARASSAVYIVDHFDDALSTILIGNNLVNIAASSLGAVVVLEIFGNDEYTWVSTVIITVSVIIFGETIPKITAKRNANRMAFSFAYIVRVLMVVFKPVTFVVVGLVKLLTFKLKGEQEESDEEVAVEELHTIIDIAEDEEVIDEDQSELIKAAIDFSDISASEVMTARVDMVAIDVDDEHDEIMNSIFDSGYSRIPVYEGSIDNVIGVLYVNHFLKEMIDNKDVDIKSMLMPTCYVYKTMKLPAVLEELRKAQQHLAIVTDEYGGTLGLVSMEDVLEEIVGEIWDETDEIEEEIVEQPNGVYELDGDMSIADFLELMNIDESSFDFDSETVGGWAIEKLEAFPKVGDTFEYENMCVEVTEVDERRVVKVLVKPINKNVEE